MDDQLKILIEPIVCSQIVEKDCELFVENKWEDQQLLGFLSLFLPEVVHLKYRNIHPDNGIMISSDGS